MSESTIRICSIAILVLCITALALLSEGSAGRRALLFALPATIAIPEPATPEAVLPLTILRVDVDEGVSEDMRIEVLTPRAPATTNLGGPEPRILIYHTHATEAYEQTDGYRYEPSGDWRTHEQDKNIVAVGEQLAKLLREEYGFNVLHDTTDHEPPKLSTAYSRSEATMKAYKAKYPSLTLFIDVHRDAGKQHLYTVVDGKKVARMMFVVGTGEGATGTGYKEMPDFESNYALALDITNRLAAVHEDLMRNIRIKTGRYNQHVSNQCLLVEMGDNSNTMDEVLNAVPYLARAIAESAQGAAPSSPPANTAPPTLWAPLS